MYRFRFLAGIACVTIVVGLATVARADEPLPWPWRAGGDWLPWPWLAGGDDSWSLSHVAHTPTQAPVYRVADVQLKATKSDPPELVAVAIGSVTTSDWRDANLQPVVYVVEPADGIYDLYFVATPPPQGSIGLPVVTPVSASLALGTPPDGFKGVRVRSATNAVVALFEAQAMSAAVADGFLDIESLGGKRFVPLGQEDTAKEGDVLEKNLPKPYRVFTPEAPMGDMMFDPNRLNLVLDGSGVIVAVYWG